MMIHVGFGFDMDEGVRIIMSHVVDIKTYGICLYVVQVGD